MQDFEGGHCAPDAPAKSEAIRPRALGLDVGTVRIGVALSCPFGRMAQPLVVLSRKDRPFAQIAELCERHEVETLVVGRPLRLNGEAGPAVAAIEKFVDVLQQRLGRQVTWVDERLSTAAAERTMISMGARRQTRRDNIDKVAAAILLQSYLDTRARAGAGDNK